MKLSNETISRIENNLKLHIDYKGVSSGGKYLIEMDKLTFNYPGARGLALSNMLGDYFSQVGVNNLSDALERIRNF